MFGMRKGALKSEYLSKKKKRLHQLNLLPNHWESLVKYFQISLLKHMKEENVTLGIHIINRLLRA